MLTRLTRWLSARACPFCGGTCRPARTIVPRDDNAPCRHCGYRPVPPQPTRQGAVSTAGSPG